MNHGGPTTSEKVQAVKQPCMVNGSDNDNSIPKDLLDEIKSVLDSKPDVPSDVKVREALFPMDGLSDTKSPSIDQVFPMEGNFAGHSLQESPYSVVQINEI